MFCSVPPLTSHIEIHMASISIGSHLSGALALYRLLPARACPIVHIHKTLAVNGTFQNDPRLPALCRSLFDFDQEFRAAVQHAIQSADPSEAYMEMSRKLLADMAAKCEQYRSIIRVTYDVTRKT
jgi:hypothetical protein